MFDEICRKTAFYNQKNAYMIEILSIYYNNPESLSNSSKPSGLF